MNNSNYPDDVSEKDIPGSSEEEIAEVKAIEFLRDKFCPSCSMLWLCKMDKFVDNCLPHYGNLYGFYRNEE